jgi:dipeptide/tripeptide permease
VTIEKEKINSARTPFPPLFWLVIIFEIFERGSSYGVMSVLSVYLTDNLQFSKTDVGNIKAIITPLLYFLPIISGALADRFGYRRTLLVAFSLLGGGYFLASQATAYAAVLLSLTVMGLGAGTFKPVISGSIARCTDATNSTVGFGIFYWTINLGAFLVPLFLVPYLKNNIGWNWVIIAAGLGTGAMLLPTLLFFREPPKPAEAKPEPPKNLVQTLANAFEILYSPVVLLFGLVQRSVAGIAIVALIGLPLLGLGGYFYTQPGKQSETLNAQVKKLGDNTLVLKIQRNLCLAAPYVISDDRKLTPACHLHPSYCSPGDREAMGKPVKVTVTLNHPDRFEGFAPALLGRLQSYSGLGSLDHASLAEMTAAARKQTTLRLVVDPGLNEAFALRKDGPDTYALTLRDKASFHSSAKPIRAALDEHPTLAAISGDKLSELLHKASSRSFFLLFVGLIFLGSLVVLRIAPLFQGASRGGRAGIALAILGSILALLWLLPHLSLLTSIICSVIATTVLALLIIDTQDKAKYKDHGKFLLMILIYSGFWILYFQMFDSVLWYVKAYVDAQALNSAVNGAAAALGIQLDWRFDVEHVTVINAGTIIALQLLVSTLVKNTRAMPTMIAGITLGTIGMAILAISTGIFTFIAGIMIFSIGEMTAHPKFIAYVGQTAPKSRVAMYMGYLFLYGVIGSSIGAILGASLYVDFVDRRNDPQTLWLIFTGIGVATVLGLLLYNRFVAKTESGPAKGGEAT